MTEHTDPTARRVLLSLHDVTPAHLARLVRAEALFHELGVSRVTYLLVPRYHGAWCADRDSDFVRWCRDPRPFAVEWCLHGWHHQERHPIQPSLRDAARDWFKRRFLTDGEGEFLGLDEVKSSALIDRGLEVFTSCLGVRPSGFVAPAWLFPRTLLPILRDAGFAWTEDHWRIYDLRGSRVLDAPAITWSSRTHVRRYLSARLSHGLSRRWREQPLIRVALHPFDFDSPRLVAAIKRTMTAALGDRTLESYDRLISAAASGADKAIRNEECGAEECGAKECGANECGVKDWR
jgi:uncharacterized protein